MARHAARRGYPVLVSANALFDRRKWKFRRPSPALSGLDVALDSAGFVAMSRYGGYSWTTDEYLKLVASFRWTWWASMDFCCEPEIAGDRREVHARMVATVEVYSKLVEKAREIGLSSPMPVLQGWRPEDYVECVEMIGELPDLVGVGSVCRRDVCGESGLEEILCTLDAVLPNRVSLHLFGVKGAALGRSWLRKRVASVDSMA